MHSHFIQVLKSQLNYSRIYSVLYDGRSGSVFLQSLLDNHPRIITFPATVLMGGLSGKHINEFLADDGLENWVQFIKNFILAYPTLFDSKIDTSGCRLNELGESRNERIKVDSSEFVALMMSISNDVKFTKRNAFLAIHLAWDTVRRGHVIDDPVILYAMHTPEHSMKEVINLFPEMKVLMATREPKATMASMFNHHIKRYEYEGLGGDFWCNKDNISYPLRYIDYFTKSYPIIDQYINENNIRVVKLEDLHYKPVETMRKVATWMEIEYQDCLLKSTFGGLLHWGDITIDYKTGPSFKELKFDWQNSYYWSDVLMLETIFSNRYKNYGYKKDFNISLELKEDWEFLEHIFNLFPMKWEVTAFSKNVSLDEITAYEILKINMHKKYERKNILEKVVLKYFKRNVEVNTTLKDSQKATLYEFIELIDKRKFVIKKYIESSIFEKKYKLI